MTTFLQLGANIYFFNTMFVDQSNMAEGEAVDPEWWGYECKSGQILFYYNKTTGEHRWANGDQVSELLNITGC